MFWILSLLIYISKGIFTRPEISILHRDKAGIDVTVVRSKSAVIKAFKAATIIKNIMVNVALYPTLILQANHPAAFTAIAKNGICNPDVLNPGEVNHRTQFLFSTL